ncbi:MAG: hypothetical protein ACRBN8_21755 [Nannocystales bacterium]
MALLVPGCGDDDAGMGAGTTEGTEGSGTGTHAASQGSAGPSTTAEAGTSGSSSSSASSASTSTGQATESESSSSGGTTLDCGDTVLGRVAASMPNRSWAEVGPGLGELQWAPPYVHPENGSVGGLDIATWSDDAQWNPGTSEIYFMGLRQTRRFVRYSAQDHMWSDVGLDDTVPDYAGPPFYNAFGHIYARNALDTSRGHFYHLQTDVHRFDIEDESWSVLPEGVDPQLTAIIEWFSARDELLNYSRDGGLRLYDPQTRAWQEYGDFDVSGHHSLGRDNPGLGEVLLAGGNDTGTVVIRVDADAQVHRMSDAPIGFGIRVDLLTVDPLTDRYLFMAGEQHLLYEFDSQADVYTLIDDFSETPWPFSSSEAPIVASIPECGVTAWATESQLQLYKHGG